MHFWCRTMLSSVKISGEWKPLQFGKEPNHWNTSGCPRRVTRGIRIQHPSAEDSMLMGKASDSWWMQLSTGQSQCPTLDTFYKHCCPFYRDRKAFLASWMVPSSVPGPSHSNTLGIFFPLYSKGNKWHLLPQVLLENYFIKN